MTGILAALVLELMRESLTGTHCRYRELVNGVPREEYVTAECGGKAAALESLTQSGGFATALLNVNGRLVRRNIRNDTAYDYDEATGALLRTIPLWFNGTPARVFDPNPVVAMNDPSLRDRNDAASAVPESSYRHVEVETSPYVTIVDRQAPFIAPVDLSSPSLVFDRASDAFEDVSAHFHIDRNQRYLQSLGYTGARGIAPYAVETDTHAAGGTDNSFFQPSFTQAGRGTLFFGTGGTDDAEDADLIVHEYSHAIQEWIAPGTFLGTFASQSRALSEGFGDYWAFSAHHAQRRASGRDPFCFADWDARCDGDDPGQECGYPADADCLRRVDSTRTMADYDRGDAGGTEHRNGAIWSGALTAIFNANVERHGPDEGKRITDTLVVEALFGTPSNPTFATMAGRILGVDRLLFGGTHVDAICGAMTARGIVAAVDCGYTPRGEVTLFQSSDRALPIPENNTDGVSSRIVISDARAIERVYVRVDIAHPSRGDLRIVLTAPDGARVVLQQVSFDRTRDLHATFGLDAAPLESLDVLHGRPANGTWTLNVADMRALDAGTLELWGLIFQFAGDVPKITRPAVANALVIPVVGHLHGSAQQFYRTDVHLLNPSAAPRTVTLIFTPSGADGRTTFSSAKVVVPANAIVALRDVLPALFAMSGSGNLVIDSVGLGDMFAAARIDSESVSQVVEPVHGARGPLSVRGAPATFSSIGVTETAGAAGEVEIVIDNVPTRVSLLPFSHLQFRSPKPHEVTWRVVSGDAEIAGYVAGHGAFYLPARPIAFDAQNVPAVFPVVDAPGARGMVWQTSISTRTMTMLTLIDPDGRSELRGWAGYLPSLAYLFPLRPPLATLRTDRSAIVIIGNDTMRFPVPTSSTGILFPIEQSDRFRTNLTLIADWPTVAHIAIHDAAGNLVDAFDRALERDRLVQLPLSRAVVDGRITVEGGIHAWASVIDNATGAFVILGTR